MSRIGEATALLRRAAEASGGKLLVFFSGGKDSLTVLDLAVRAEIPVECVYMYFIDGLQCVEDGLTRALARFPGVKLHKVPDPSLSHCLSEGILCVGRPVRKVQLADIERYMRKVTGIEWVVSGARSKDSFTRSMYVGKCSGYNEQGRRVYPIWNWNTSDVVAYLRGRRIHLPKRFQKMTEHGVSGVSLMPDFLAWVETAYPDDYARIADLFPFVGVWKAREKFYGAQVVAGQRTP